MIDVRKQSKPNKGAFSHAGHAQHGNLKKENVFASGENSRQAEAKYVCKLNNKVFLKFHSTNFDIIESRIESNRVANTFILLEYCQLECIDRRLNYAHAPLNASANT